MSFYPTFQSRFARMQPDFGDPLLNNYILEHEYRVFFDRSYRFALWSPPFFYPEKHVLAYGDNFFVGEPLYALLRSTFDPSTSFQLWMMLVVAADYLAFLFLARSLRIIPPLAAFGAFLLAFGNPAKAQFSHVQLLVSMFSPFALLFTWRFLRAPSRRLAAGAAIFLYLQFLGSYYVGWMLLLAEAVFAGAVLFLDREARRRTANFFRRRAGFTILVSTGWLTALFFLMRPYWVALQSLRWRQWRAVADFLPHVWSWFLAQPGSIYDRWFHPPKWAQARWEQNLFCGFVFWLTAGLSLMYIARRSRGEEKDRIFVAAAWGTFLALFLLSLRIPGRLADFIPGSRSLLSSETSLWRIVYLLVPGAKAIRAVSRIWTAAYLFLFAGALLGADRWIHRHIASGRARLALAATILILGIAEQWNPRLPSFRKSEFFDRAAAVSHALRRRGCEVGYVEPDPTLPGYTSQLLAMWAGMEAGVPVVNGYSGNVPPGYPRDAHGMEPHEMAVWLAASARRVCEVPLSAKRGSAGAFGPIGPRRWRARASRIEESSKAKDAPE